ncbi:MAG: NADH-quinone oxidoreductase subunit NuoB [Desulfitobacteriia bacterium]|jgi:Ni,Fe-hydrogenase III small subunit/formate hydrogenlyase subunit 6/NADH:ubiquinone oxidoreductase subunit I
MFNIIKKVIKYPRLTQSYPHKPFDLGQAVGSPLIDSEVCNRCGKCMPRCPSQAIAINNITKEIGINYDQCIFCLLCQEICPVGAAKITSRFELATKDKNGLRTVAAVEPEDLSETSYEVICSELKANIKKLFGRSLQIREVDSGSCNACDYEINALNNPFLDIERLGINFVASPRHADMLLVTGTATRNMHQALIKTYNATPDPKLVVAVGACACSGGIFRDTYATSNGIDSIVPVDVYIPGCPPRPQAILYGILKALDRVK